MARQQLARGKAQLIRQKLGAKTPSFAKTWRRPDEILLREKVKQNNKHASILVVV